MPRAILNFCADIGTLSDDTHYFISTTDGANNGRITAVSASELDQTKSGSSIELRPVVPVHSDGLNLLEARLVDHSVLVLVYLKHACAAAVFADARSGKLIGKADSKGTRGHAAATSDTNIPIPVEELPNPSHDDHAAVIPAYATISTISSRSDSSDFYLSVDTFVAPPYVLAGKVTYSKSGDEPDIILSRLGRAAHVGEDLVCSLRFYESFDGVKIPMFISHARDLDLSVPQPTLLYAYGGSAVCITPTFNPLFTTFMRHVRGM